MSEFLITAYVVSVVPAAILAAAWCMDALDARTRWSHNSGRRAYWSRQALLRLVLVLPVAAAWPVALLVVAGLWLRDLIRDAIGGVS